MRLCVLGSTGGIGRCLVDQAVARGHDVVAVLRRDPTFQATGVQCVRGDVLDRELVRRAVNGCDAVASALGIRRTVPSNPWSALASPPDFSSRTARHVVDAMQREGVRRVTAVSAAGVGDSRALLPAPFALGLAATQLGPMYADLERLETVYRDSGLDWQCVRPMVLTNRGATGEPRVVERIGWTATIARADVATFMLDELERGAFTARTPLLAR